VERESNVIGFKCIRLRTNDVTVRETFDHPVLLAEGGSDTHSHTHILT